MQERLLLLVPQEEEQEDQGEGRQEREEEQQEERRCWVTRSLGQPSKKMFCLAEVFGQDFLWENFFT